MMQEKMMQEMKVKVARVVAKGLGWSDTQFQKCVDTLAAKYEQDRADVHIELERMYMTEIGFEFTDADAECIREVYNM